MPQKFHRLLRGVPENSDVVAYCRGPSCGFADDAVRTLRRAGYRAARLENGYPGWANIDAARHFRAVQAMRRRGRQVKVIRPIALP